MSSGEAPDIDDVVSERETQFVPRSDDDEVLWEVQEITAERGKKYRVKWVGVDPATGKPWAQSWVAKHDCTDKLVAEWKAKKRKLAAGKKRGGRTSTTSWASSASKRTGSSTSDKKTRHATSEATSSCVNSVERLLSPPPKKLAAKRKRQSEIPATTSTGTVQADEREESRPLKKQRTIVESLLPPMSSDEDDEALQLLESRSTAAVENKGSSKRNGASLDDSDVDYSSPPKAKGKSGRGSDARSGGAGGSKAPDSREGSKLTHSRMKAEVVIPRKGRVTDAGVQSTASEDEDEEPRQPKSKTTSTSKRRLLSEQTEELSEKEGESVVSAIKIGPPRGAKRQDKSRKSGLPNVPGTPRTNSREESSTDGHVAAEGSKGCSSRTTSPFGRPQLLEQDTVGNRTPVSPPSHVSIPLVPSNTRPRSPNLSPGARARLELFDRMMAEVSQPDTAPPPADVSEHVPADTHFNFDDIHDTHGPIGPLDALRQQSPPPSKSKPKDANLGTPNGLIVPETESSQSQSQSLLKTHPPLACDPSPRKPVDLPTIAVITASATSSSISPQDLIPPPQKLPPSAKRPPKKSILKPVPQISPSTFRSTINARARAAGPEAPPSSIESFTSPRPIDKGKRRAVEEDQLKSSLSEGEGNARKTRVERRLTDSELKKRGKELFDQVQLAREAERQKKKKAKRLKNVNDIVNGTFSSPPKGSPRPFVGGTEGTLEVSWEEVVDLSGGANSTTLDSPEHSEAQPLSEEARERLRIELRQEEEEDTQEAMGTLLAPVKVAEGTKSGDAPKNPPMGGQVQVADHVEQPSADLQQASVIVQASQEQRHEDMDVEPLLVNQYISSPARPIPENLTDSPERRLGEALSLLHVKSEEIQRLEHELADERKNIQDLKVKLAEVQQSSEPTDPVRTAWEAERAQWSQGRSKWENDFSLWEMQRKEWSHERESLLARIAELSDAAIRAEEARAKLSELEAERVAWTKERDAAANDITQRSEELAVLTKDRGEYEQDRLKWEEERASWVEEKARWETEREALQEKQETLLRSVDELTAQVESMTAAKVSVENDRDFFREQYAQASGFVGSVREENVELEKRVKIAEGQAQEGVAAIRALFEGRVNALQADVNRWKGLTELLQEKDRRTNDELRLRAAQFPDLGDLCGRLQSENKVLGAEIRKLGLAQQRSVVQRSKLYYQVLALKKERASLRSKLPQLPKAIDNSAQEASHPVPALPIFDDPENMDPNDMEMLPDPVPPSSVVGFDEPALFPCMWRPEWRDQCPQIFDTKEDLERHVQEHFRDLLTQ